MPSLTTESQGSAPSRRAIPATGSLPPKAPSLFSIDVSEAMEFVKPAQDRHRSWHLIGLAPPPLGPAVSKLFRLHRQSAQLAARQLLPITHARAHAHLPILRARLGRRPAMMREPFFISYSYFLL